MPFVPSNLDDALFRLFGMRRLHTTVGAGVMLLAITACAGQQQDIGFGGQVPPSPPGPAVPKPVEQRTPVPANQVPPEFSGKVWTQDGGTVIVATGREGGCSKVHAETVEQTPKQVKIALVNKNPKPVQVCTMDLRYPPVATRIDAPLNKRTVVIEQREVTVPR